MKRYNHFPKTSFISFSAFDKSPSQYCYEYFNIQKDLAMAFWDNVKSIAIRSRCTVGWHEGEYKHIDGKPECYF